MAKFLSGKKLDGAISDIVFKAKKELLILSPYIKLDKFFRTIFDSQASNSELRIIIGFGKNEGNINRSLNKEDFEYFKKFPNIFIVYTPNLHAKYYANEEMGIITSINLYDFSFKNNVEYGVLFESNLLGTSKTDVEAWEASYKLLADNYAVFIRKPKFKRKIIGKDYLGSDILLDLTNDLIRNRKIEKRSIIDFESEDNILEIFKLEKKPTREEVENTNHIDIFQDQKELSKTEKKKDEKSGYCIKCKTLISLNPDYPYCKACYKSLNQYHLVTDSEKYCHACGKIYRVSQKKPLCNSCY